VEDLMRKWWALVVGLMLVSVLPLSALAITNGNVDADNDYPMVGMVAFYDSNYTYMHRCTGTLIAENVVLTAGHCTDGTSTAYAYFDMEAPSDFRTNPSGEKGHTVTHPQYNPLTISNDVGVVVLDEPSDVSAPYPTLPDVGFLSDLKRSHQIQDDTFVAVGYGLVPDFPPNIFNADLYRRWAVSPYRGLTKDNLHLFQNPNVNDAGGTCFGDSGGPHFWNDELVLVAVTSWGDAICRANDMTQRLDLEPIHLFIEEYLP
jgi:secreted trypsin-like serine protease